MLTRPFLAAIAVAAILLPSLAMAYESRARAAFVYDVTTGTVLYEKDADAPLPQQLEPGLAALRARGETRLLPEPEHRGGSRVRPGLGPRVPEGRARARRQLGNQRQVDGG